MISTVNVANIIVIRNTIAIAKWGALGMNPNIMSTTKHILNRKSFINRVSLLPILSCKMPENE